MKHTPVAFFILCVVLFIFLVTRPHEPSREYLPQFPPVIQAKVIKKKNVLSSGRPAYFIHIKDIVTDSLYTLNISNTLFDECRVGDWVYKRDSSLLYLFYHADTFYHSLNLNSCEVYTYYHWPCYTYHKALGEYELTTPPAYTKSAR